MTLRLVLALSPLLSASVLGFTTVLPSRTSDRGIVSNTQLFDIVSPFDSSESAGRATVTQEKPKLEGPLDLTWENVEAVLDEMRHFLIQDGGNVAIQEIDGPVVRLELQGACGTCPSSTQTMKMGLGKIFLFTGYCVRTFKKIRP